MTLRTLFYHYRILLRNKKGLALLLIQPFVLGGLWCYRSSLPFILLETYDVSLESYSYYLAPMIIVHLLFSFLAQETVLKVGSQKLIQAGVGFLLIGAMSEILIFMLGWVTPLTFTLAFLPFVAGYSLSLSTSLVTGIGRFNIVTLAASMTVFLRMIGCALGGVAASYFDESSILGLNMFLLSAAVVSILLYFYAFSHRKET